MSVVPAVLLYQPTSREQECALQTVAPAQEVTTKKITADSPNLALQIVTAGGWKHQDQHVHRVLNLHLGVINQQTEWENRERVPRTAGARIRPKTEEKTNEQARRQSTANRSLEPVSCNTG